MVKRPRFSGITHHLEVLDPHVVDLTIGVLVHLAGIVEPPAAQMMDGADDVVERMTIEERTDLEDRMRTVVGLDAEKHVVGESGLERLHLGDVIAQLARAHGELGVALRQQWEVIGDADADETLRAGRLYILAGMP